jgi:hypothetical protein
MEATTFKMQEYRGTVIVNGETKYTSRITTCYSYAEYLAKRSKPAQRFGGFAAIRVLDEKGRFC